MEWTHLVYAKEPNATLDPRGAERGNYLNLTCTDYAPTKGQLQPFVFFHLTLNGIKSQTAALINAKKLYCFLRAVSMNPFFLSAKKFISSTLFFSLVLMASCATGPRPKPWVLSINKTTTASIQVDLIGITPSEQPYWEGYNLDKYWSDGDRRRAGANKLSQTLMYNKPWRVELSNQKWQEWFNHGATHLLIIANLPGSFDSGPADPRRLIIPLDKHAWKSNNNTIEIQVQDTILTILTPQKPR